MDFMARDSLFRNPLFGSLIRSLNAFPLQREKADVAAIKHIIDRLKNDRMIVLFPEATRTWDGSILPIKSGFDLIARRAKAAIVPTVIDGAFEAWPRHQLLPYPGPIRVMYGKPISYETAKSLSRPQLIRQVNETLRSMQNELRLRYGKKPYHYPNNENP
jgi:1-acyl-sn-glycerol-3-phosphate acyltransferase